MGITITKAKKSDYEDFVGVFSQTEEAHRLNIPWYFKKPESELFPKDYYQEILKNKDALFLFAKDNKEIIGFIIGFKDNSPQQSSLVQTRFISIDELVVKQSYRKKGIGSLLMEALEQWAKDNQIYDIRLSVFSFNENAIDFYKNKGYSTYSQKMRKTL